MVLYLASTTVSYKKKILLISADRLISIHYIRHSWIIFTLLYMYIISEIMISLSCMVYKQWDCKGSNISSIYRIYYYIQTVCENDDYGPYMNFLIVRSSDYINLYKSKQLSPETFLIKCRFINELSFNNF